MKELNWKHIRNTVAITTLVSPIFILAYAIILAVTLSSAFTSITIFLAVCFVLGVVTPAFIIGGASPDSKRKVLHGSVSTGLALPTAALSTFLLLSVINFYTSPPSDWRLIRRFERNEALFNELRDAVQGDGGLESISLEHVSPTDFETVGVSLGQLKHYRRAMKRLGVKGVDEGGKYQKVQYISFSLVRNGSNIYKSYIYQQTPPFSEQIVEEITEEAIDSNREVYRPIEDGWYLHAFNESDY